MDSSLQALCRRIETSPDLVGETQYNAVWGVGSARKPRAPTQGPCNVSELRHLSSDVRRPTMSEGQKKTSWLKPFWLRLKSTCLLGS